MINYDVAALHAIIERYSKRIEEVRKNEIYKWEASYRFQQHWNPDAADFAAMLESSFPMSSNLIAGPSWFPVGMLKIFAKNDPKAVRAAMLSLLDEKKPLRDRMVAFANQAGEWLKAENAKRAEKGEQPAKNHFQDTRAMSVYLAFANPAHNYLYKTEMYRNFAKAVGIEVPGNKFDKVIAYKELCDGILKHIEDEWPELIAQSDTLLPPEFQDADPARHMLVQDIVYYAVAYMPSEKPPADSDGAPRIWMYAPGHGASAWEECVEQGIMVLGWDEIGDYAQYPTREAITDALKKANEDESSMVMSSLACWQFQHDMQPGDVVYAKRGMYAIVGKGIVKSEPRYEPERKSYTQVRDVEWVAIGDWDIRAAAIPMGDGETMKTLPMKTLTEWTMYPEAVEAVERLISGTALPSDEGASDCRYWWLSASPKIWSFSDIAIGDEQSYTLFNEKGNPRRIQKNFLAAAPGDVIVGYEATPVKKVVAICEVSRPHDDGRMYFKKVRDLKEPVTFKQIKSDDVLSRTEFMRNPNGSFFALTEDEYVRLEEYLEEEGSPVENKPDPYDDDAFLEDVFMDADGLEELKSLLKRKKNVILQGAPGTGKTFAAKRLAWAIMGCKDASRIQQVQFHQSTTYDDFVYGYRPNADGGFETVPGTFVEFCKRAAAQPDKEHFFIIDEINRANISKVFGELLMLIEADHRGESVVLPVSGERFSVPTNVYVIGMMNTADRGLALIDYALRRRFAFFEMEPALKNERFEEQAAISGEKMTSLVYAVVKLNDAIEGEASLGRGFRIGHSYFCPDADGNPVDPASVVKYELAPLVEEYWFDDEKRAREEIGKLKAAVE